MDSFFISGTDTGIGKTLISAMLLLASGGRYWKPVQSGTIDGTDTETVRKLTGLGVGHFEKESYMLEQPLSPHLSAQIDNIHIDIATILADYEKIQTRGRQHANADSDADTIDYKSLPIKSIIIEGAGGLLVPLNENNLVIDLITEIGLPVILTSRSTLGTINHTLLSLEALRSRHVPVAGVVMSGPFTPENKKAIETYGRVKVLAEIPVLAEIDKPDLLLYGSLMMDALRT
jgi:dethiobiotin synthetase